MSQLFQLHIDDCLGLNVIKVKPLHKAVLCVLRITAAADNLYNFIYIINSNNKRFYNMSTGFCLCQLKLRTARNHTVTVLHKILYYLLDGQNLRSAVYKRKVDDTEVRLQRRLSEQLVQNNLCHCSAL